MSDRIAVVTGGTRGIGLSVVKMLLQCDIHVIIGKQVFKLKFTLFNKMHQTENN